MGGTEVKAPKPSGAEKNLQKMQADMLAEQTKILKQQQANQALLMPFMAEQYGIKVNFDDKGNITGFEDTDVEGKARRDEIQRLQEERSLAALKGELEVDPVLERSLGEQEETLRERLQAQFGPGYETSSPGIETMDKFMQSAEGLRYGARTGQMSLAEQLSLARNASNMAGAASGAGGLQAATLGQALGLAGAFGSSAGGYGQAQQGYQFDRQLMYDASKQNAANRTAMWTGAMEAAGTIGGGYFSDRDLKENISRIGQMLEGPGIYIYSIKGDPEHRLYMGVMADEVEAVRPDVIDNSMGFKTVNYGAL